MANLTFGEHMVQHFLELDPACPHCQEQERLERDLAANPPKSTAEIYSHITRATGPCAVCGDERKLFVWQGQGLCIECSAPDGNSPQDFVAEWTGLGLPSADELTSNLAYAYIAAAKQIWERLPA